MLEDPYKRLREDKESKVAEAGSGISETAEATRKILYGTHKGLYQDEESPTEPESSELVIHDIDRSFLFCCAGNCLAYTEMLSCTNIFTNASSNVDAMRDEYLKPYGLYSCWLCAVCCYFPLKIILSILRTITYAIIDLFGFILFFITILISCIFAECVGEHSPWKCGFWWSAQPHYSYENEPYKDYPTKISLFCCLFGEVLLFTLYHVAVVVLGLLFLIFYCLFCGCFWIKPRDYTGESTTAGELHRLGFFYYPVNNFFWAIEKFFACFLTKSSV